MEAVNDFVVHARKEAGLTKSSAEGSARDVKNFRGASFSFRSFSFGRAKENEHRQLQYQRAHPAFASSSLSEFLTRYERLRSGNLYTQPATKIC